MSVTTNLEITHVEESQSQKEVTINAALDKLDDLGLGAFAFDIDGGGAEIADGVQRLVPCGVAFTITSVTALADQSGDIVVDVWKDTYANYPPTDADTITASAPITISSAIKSVDSTLTGWTTAVAAGDNLIFNVDSCTTIERCTIMVQFVRTVA